MASIGFDFKPARTVIGASFAWTSYNVPTNRYARLQGFLNYGTIFVDGNVIFASGTSGNRIYVDLWLKAGQALTFGQLASSAANFQGHVTEYQE